MRDHRLHVVIGVFETMWVLGCLGDTTAFSGDIVTIIFEDHISLLIVYSHCRYCSILPHPFCTASSALVQCFFYRPAKSRLFLLDVGTGLYVYLR